jgi:elongation factor G
MTAYTTEDIRNIALVGQAGAGKTTLNEALLYHGGALATPGSVEKGTATTDYDPLEHKYHHSINSAVVGLDYKGKHINLIDTPGSPDFLGATISALAAVEAVAVVINAQTGVDILTRQLMEIARDCRCCRMIVINKIDDERVDLKALLKQLQDTFGKECLPINLPAEGRRRVVDCFFNPAGNADFSSVAEAHAALVDQVVEVDDALMERYLEQGEISPEELHDPFEAALREGHIIPVCFTSAQHSVGIKELLDVFVKLAPNPAEGNPHPFVNGTTPLKIMPSADGHVLGHVFKVDFDPFAGKFGVFRVHQGTVSRDSQLFVDDHRKPIKVGHLFRIHGKDHVEIERGIPGDICALAKVEELHLDSILHDSHDEDHVHMKPPWFPAPMTGLAIAVRRRGDEQKVSDALAKLSEEDPCLKVERDASSNETVLQGLGALHLKIALEKLDTRYHIQVDTHSPSIPYRETITAPAEGHYRHKKQSGGAGQFGEVYLRIEPLARGAGFEFVNNITGGVIPGGFIPAVEKGVRQAMETGVLAGYPLQDIRVEAYDGKHHSVDSNEISFVIAGRKAFFDAALNATPMVLEPIVDLAVTAPEGNIGDLTGDLSARRARITRTDTVPGGMMTISAQAPLAELDNYLARLKSITGGEGSFTTQFSHYDPVPPHIQEQLIANRKAQAEEG